MNTIVKILIIFLILIAGIIGYIIWSINIAFEDLCGATIRSETLSPDSTFKSVNFIFDCGATTSNSYNIALLKPSEILREDHNPANVFTAENASDLYVYWLDNETLLVKYDTCKARVYKKEAIYMDIIILYEHQSFDHKNISTNTDNISSHELLKVVNGDDAYHCLPYSEFSIAGITWNADKAEVEKVNGKPLKSTKCDDGAWAGDVWEYENVIIEFYNNRAIKIYTKSNKSSTPSGIRPGISKGSFLNLLGNSFQKEIAIISTDGFEYQFVNCPNEKYNGVYLICRFNEKEIITSVELSIDLP